MRNLNDHKTTHPVPDCRYIAYTESGRTARGLSDRRACLAALLAEAEASGRIPILPRFHLNTDHNQGIWLLPSNLLEYVSLSKFANVLSGYVTSDEFHHNDISSKRVVNGEPASASKDAAEQLVERRWPNGNWWNGLPDTKRRLDEFHGELGGHRGWFRPPSYVYEFAKNIADTIDGNYLGMHIRRRDRLINNPYLNKATQSQAILRRIAPYTGKMRNLYIATDEQDPRHFDLLRSHYNVFTASNFDCFDTPELKYNNFLRYAIEMCVVDLATVSFFTFTNSGHWYDLNVNAPCFSVTDYPKGYVRARVRWIRRIRKFRLLTLASVRRVPSGLASPDRFH